MGALLDDVLPRYDVNEVHDAWVAAPPAETYEAVRAVTPLEVRLLVPLMLLRALPGLVMQRRLPAADLRAPVIDAFLRNGFLVLAERPGEEIVVGSVGRFWTLRSTDAVRPVASLAEFAAFAEPGFARAVTNFHVSGERDGSRVTTETRIAGTDAQGTRQFRRYWQMVGPGSGVIRLSWLNAVRRRAERA